MVELATAAAVGLLALGVVGSVAPVLPGAALSLAGVYLHWWASGYTEPGLLILVAFTLVGVVGVVVDLFGAALGAKAGGATRRTVVAAAVVGVALFFVAGPVGVLVGIAGTAFAAEYSRTRDLRTGVRAAAATTLGLLGSVLVQFLLTLSMLVGFLGLLVL